VQAIKFILTGKTAFFKKPDVNINTYFTYNNIHRVALLGLLGAIIGLKGHIQQSRSIKEGSTEYIDYPEFYSKLNNLKICIKPKGNKGYFTKKIQVFNNSVGYASKEAGGNLIVKEQWLENPEWEIYLLENKSIEKNVFEKLKEYLANSKCTYIPYLGKNDHPATIKDYEVIELQEVKETDHIDSLFPLETVEFGEGSYEEGEKLYFFKEFAPNLLSKQYNFYEFIELCYTNMFIEEIKDDENIYNSKYGILAFF
jgi:CRISPR-associated protein Cas5h